jgi:hypothetical protein
MNYKKKIVATSIVIHFIGLSALLVYWIYTTDVTPPPTSEPESVSSTGDAKGSNTDASPQSNKSLHEDYAEGDFSKTQIKELVLNATKDQKLSEEDLDEKFDELATVPVKEVKEMASIVAKATGAELTKSSQPLKERGLRDTIDINSLHLYDYQINEEKYTLIYKDKNNIFIKEGPYSYEELEDDTKLRLQLLKRAKENSKFRILLDATQSILENISTESNQKK